MSYVPLIRRVHNSTKSSVEKYQDLFVGSRSLPELIRYELIVTVLQSFPGAAGIYLRDKLYRLLFKSCGKDIFIGRNVTIRVPGRIELGNSIIVDDNAVLDAKGDAACSFIRCGDQVEISRNAILSCKGEGSITMGDFVSIGRNALLSALAKLEIGSYCSIGPYASILASGHDWSDPDTPILLQNRRVQSIVLGENVWIGAHATIMDGVTIGENSIVGVGSVVTKDVPPYRTVAGSPARIVRIREPKREATVDGDQ